MYIMKKISFAILLIFVFCSVAFAAIKDSPDGFRGVKWGDKPTALGASKLEEEAYGIQIYTRHKEKLKIGEANLTEILYFFNEEKFICVTIESKGSNNIKALKTALTLRYGEDFIESPHGELIWGDWNAMVVLQTPEKDTASVLIANTTASVDLLGKIAQMALEKLNSEESARKSIADDF